MIKNVYELSISVSISILFISLFIILFFFTYGLYIEKKVVKEQMNFLATNISYIFKLFGQNITDKIKYNINNIKDINFDEIDNRIAKKNKDTISSTISINILFIIVVLAIVSSIYKISNNSVNLKNILIKNSIILMFIALNPNIVYYNVIKNLDKIYDKNLDKIKSN